MRRSIQSIEWKRAGAETATDVTDAIEEGVVAATPHPDETIDRPKGYSVRLRLKPDRAAFAEDLQEALMDVAPSFVTLRLEGVDDPIRDVPVSVSKVPYPGEQNVAELGVKPEGHDAFHEYF